MAKRKLEEGQETFPPEVNESFPPREPPAVGEGQAGDSPKKSTWQSRFGIYGDYGAGVRLIEDRQNRRMTIQFEEKPSKAVHALLKGDKHGFRFDSGDQVWYKRIDQAKPRQSREEAEVLAQTVAQMVHAEKGLPPLQASSPSV
jgi:hypothetical protein